MRYSAVIISALAATAFASQVSQDAATDNALPRFAVINAEGNDDLEVKKGGSRGGGSVDFDFDDDSDDSVKRGAAGASFRVPGLTASALGLAAAFYAGFF